MMVTFLEYGGTDIRRAARRPAGGGQALDLGLGDPLRLFTSRAKGNGKAVADRIPNETLGAHSADREDAGDVLAEEKL